MTKLPKEIIVTGIPYKILPPDGDYDQGCDSGKQHIYVMEAAALPRKRQYIFWEVTLLLMEAAGIPEKVYKRYHKQVGAVLNRFIIDNNLDWVKSSTPSPNTIWINGLPYAVKRNEDDILRSRDLGGEVHYNTLSISISTEMEADISTYVTIHECTHAILFESIAGTLHSQETIVEALAWQLYYFIRDNDLSILKPEGD